jgi:hypothetical protein
MSPASVMAKSCQRVCAVPKLHTPAKRVDIDPPRRQAITARHLQVGKFVQQDRRENDCDEQHCQCEAAQAHHAPERPGQNGGGDEESRVQIDRYPLVLPDLHDAVLH